MRRCEDAVLRESCPASMRWISIGNILGPARLRHRFDTGQTLPTPARETREQKSQSQRLRLHYSVPSTSFRVSNSQMTKPELPKMRIVLVLAIASAPCSCKREADAVFKTEAVSKGSLSETVAATGELSAVVTVTVGSQISGAIS